MDLIARVTTISFSAIILALAFSIVVLLLTETFNTLKIKRDVLIKDSESTEEREDQ